MFILVISIDVFALAVYHSVAGPAAIFSRHYGILIRHSHYPHVNPAHASPQAR